MNFWDASALVPLCVKEPGTARVRPLWGRAANVASLLSRTEILSALCRRQRDGSLDEKTVLLARARRDALLDALHLVRDIPEVLRRADRLLLMHPLRSADALHLAAALLATDDAPQGHGFVTLDERLSRAAAKEGFLPLPAAAER